MPNPDRMTIIRRRTPESAAMVAGVERAVKMLK